MNIKKLCLEKKIILFFFSLLLCLFFKNLFPSKKKFNIIFIETNEYTNLFNFGQSCSIESAAFHNPDANIKIFTLKNKYLNEKISKKYTNIKQFVITPNYVFKDTIFHDWWKRNKMLLLRNRYAINDLSNTFRVALIYKLGGIYLDLDIITLKNLRPLLKFNGMGLSKDNKSFQINNAVLIFKKKHFFLNTLLINIMRNYKINSWGNNGVKSILRTLKEIYSNFNYNNILVKINDLKLKHERSNKNINRTNLKVIKQDIDLVIFDKIFFYPFHWTEAKEIFEKKSPLFESKIIGSYGIHFYNKISKEWKIRKNDNSLIELISNFNCPLSNSIFLN